MTISAEFERNSSCLGCGLITVILSPPPLFVCACFFNSCTIIHAIWRRGQHSKLIPRWYAPLSRRALSLSGSLSVYDCEAESDSLQARETLPLLQDAVDGAADRNRTDDTSLEGWGFAVKLQRRMCRMQLAAYILRVLSFQLSEESSMGADRTPIGATCRTRTDNLLITNQLLYH